MHPILSRLKVFGVLTLAGLLLVGPAHGAFTVDPNRLGTWRSYTGPNSLGTAPGDYIVFQGFVAPTSLGVTLGATSPTGFAVSPFSCAPQAINPRLCFTSTPFSGNDADLGSWTLRFSDGVSTQTFASPSLQGAVNRIPLASSLALNGTGTQPTITWSLPGAYKPDFYRLIIRDKNNLTLTGLPNNILSIDFAGTATEFKVPAVFPGSGLSLVSGGQYVMSLGLVETRGHLPYTGNDNQILNRSNTFIDFSPLPPGAPSTVYMPTLVNGVFAFNLLNVNTTTIYYLDPPTVNGYRYESSDGSPSFSSVLLPQVGDGVFTVKYEQSGAQLEKEVRSGEAFAFGESGVSAFTVLGIEESAGLSPGDPSAFITGVTFATSGDFQGSMTPLAIPEPSTWALMFFGLVSLVGARKFRKVDHSALMMSGRLMIKNGSREAAI